jgi:integrase
MREAVITWIWECGRAAGPAMKIKTRPYANDTTRFHVDIRFMNPCNENDEIRRRLVAPPGLDDKQARLWGERQVPLILRELVGLKGDAANGAPMKETHTRAPRTTLAAFYESRFLPEHVALQKRATQDGYYSVYTNHIAPLLGDLPLTAIDEDRISTFRAELRKRIGVNTTNLVLSKLAKMLRFAKKRKLLAVLPDVEKLPSPRPEPKRVFSDVQIAQLNDAAAERSSESLLICLLALDGNLRVSEICALEWEDVDFAAGTIIIRHNVYKGERQTPKGEIKTLAVSKAVMRALTKHQKRRLEADEPEAATSSPTTCSSATRTSAPASSTSASPACRSTAVTCPSGQLRTRAPPPRRLTMTCPFRHPTARARNRTPTKSFLAPAHGHLPPGRTRCSARAPPSPRRTRRA